MASQALQLTANTAQIGIAIPLCYGYVWASGNRLGSLTQGDGSNIIVNTLGEGEWDGIDKLYVNRVLFDLGQVHFHPGIDGEVGTGSTGGDQEGDALMGSLNFDAQLTLSRTAYIALTVPADPDAVSAEVEIIGSYRGLKVRVFDATGTQTDYAWTTNGAWQTLDLLLRGYVKQTALINAALTSAEKARFDFSSFTDAAAYNDEIITGTKNKRFESSVAFIQGTSLESALEQLLLVSRCWLREVSGQIQLRSDKPRTAVFSLTSKHIDLSTVKTASKSAQAGAANQFTGNFLDVDGKIATIAPAIVQGLVRASGTVTCTLMAAASVNIGDKIGVIKCDDDSFLISDAPITVKTNDTTLEWAQAGGDAVSGGGLLVSELQRFAARSVVLDHEANQKSKGSFGIGIPATPKITGVTLDFGTCSEDQARRLLYFQKVRTLGLDQSPYAAPFNLSVDALMDCEDDAGNLLGDVHPGDLVSIAQDVSEEMAADYELIEKDIDLGGLNNQLASVGQSQSPSADPPRTTLALLEYVPDAYADILPEDEDDIELPPPGVSATQFQAPRQFAVAANDGPDTSVPWRDSNGNPLGSGTYGTSPFAVLTANSTVLGDGSVVPGDYETNWLHLFDFNFVVPAGAAIKGIEIKYDRTWGSNADSFIYDDGLFILQAGSHNGNDHSAGQWPSQNTPDGRNPDGSWPSAVVEYGANDDAWTLTLAGSDVTVVTFGLALRLKFHAASIALVPALSQFAMRLFYQ